MATDDQHDDDRDESRTNPDRPAQRDAGPPSVEDLQTQLRAEREEKERIRAALAKVNKEDQAKRRRLEDLEKAEQEKKDATLGETEREKKARVEAEHRAAEADRRVEAAERALDELRLERQVEAEARRFNGGIGFVNPELAYKLIDRSRVDFDGDTSQWNGVREAVDKLAKDYPSLVAQKRPGPGSPPRDEFPGNTPPHRRGATHRAEPADAFQAAQAAISSTYERM
jgi:hypothetical protein